MSLIRRVLAWPFWAMLVLTGTGIGWFGLAMTFVLGYLVMAPCEWLYFTISGTHYCGGEYHPWPQKYCKMCHYPSNPNGRYPEGDTWMED